MSLETAASIGLGLLKNREAVGTALGLGKLGGQGFAKIAARVKAELNALEDTNPNNINTLQALNNLSHFDADKNGQVTKDELTQGLQKLTGAGIANNGQFKKLYTMGEMMLKNYDKLAQLDGNASGISYQDIGKLANQDQRVATIALADWGKLNA